MNIPLRKYHPLIKVVNNYLIDYPTPLNISLFWNLGSLLGLALVIQIARGLFLSIFYRPDVNLAFTTLIHTNRDVLRGWIIHSIHANGASLFFLCVYIHIARGLYYFSFKLKETWFIGVILYVVLIATAFMGYVLPWGQMRFWGATVITNLLSAIPYCGQDLVTWVWGGFAVDNPTLTRFFALHFLLPFIVAVLSILHVIFLHQTGRNNPLGISARSYKVFIHPYFIYKDIIGFSAILILLSFIVLFTPNILGEPENFIPANPLSTPLHIKPEWYFLWLYAILRRIPDKLRGVIAIFTAILIIALFPFIFKTLKNSLAFYPLPQYFYWSLISSILLLTWIGGCPVEYPYDMLGMVFSAAYFMLIFINPIIIPILDKFYSN